MLDLRRRELIALLGGAAAWPLAAPAALASEASGQRGDSKVRAPHTRPEPGSSARAQHPAVPVIGFLSIRSPDTDAPLMVSFRQALNAGSFVEGSNVAVEYRYAQGLPSRLPSLVSDLVRRQVAIIVTT